MRETSGRDVAAPALAARLAAMEPAPFDDILAANREYAAGFHLHGLAGSAAKGLGVLTCIDSRIEPLEMLGLAPGDAKIVRNAGARLTRDVLRSLVLATNFLAVERIMIVAHTDCAMARSGDEIRADLAALHPGADVHGFELHAAPRQESVLVDDVRRLRANELLPDGVVVEGFLYDVDTGLLTHVPAS